MAAACFTATLLSSTRASRMIGARPTLAGVMLLGLLLALPIAALTVGDTRPTAAQIPYLLIAGLGNVIGLGSQYIAVRTGKVGVVGALAASEGAIAAVLAMIAGETLLQIEVIGVAVVGLGVVLASLGRDPDTADPRASARAIAFGALAGLSFGASLYATGRIGADLAAGWAILPPRVIGVALITLPLAVSGRFRITRAALPFVAVAGPRGRRVPRHRLGSAREHRHHVRARGAVRDGRRGPRVAGLRGAVGPAAMGRHRFCSGRCRLVSPRDCVAP